ncbi:MAG: hypoxanthine phosphoribosyltransferase [Polyangiaceae bacterium]|nr:hypoxanthine phosphoribosyltransferase [Polyangiaceae bacterium]MCW5790303.1 hypoxanthine phosphoribosyltransferase [Polyangiaceae bacterium]
MEPAKPPVDIREGISVIFTEEQIRARVQELGEQITRDYAGGNLVLLCILKGSCLFMADLARAIALPLRMEFMGVSSYGEDTKTSGVVQITQDVSTPLADLDVLIVEDIVDTGLTLSYLQEQIHTRRPASVRVCSLLHKPARKVREIHIDYLGFTIEDRFVVGYGLDWSQKLRNLPFIGEVTDPSKPR